jgi:hypothetical protein
MWALRSVGSAKKVIIIRGAQPDWEIHPVMKIEDLGTE